MNIQKSSLRHPLISIAALFIIIAGLKLAQSIVVPILLALFISILSAPLLLWLKQKKISNSLSLLFILMVLSIIGLSLAYLVGTSANSFSENIPFYETQLKLKLNSLYSEVHTKGINLESIKINEILNPSKVIRYISLGLSQIGSILTQSILILLIVAFILLEATSLYTKLQMITNNNAKKIQKIKELINKINHYMRIKIIISFITGTLITLFLFIFNIHYPLLWGTLAFLLNFIPNIGSIIAVIPVFILAIIQHGFTEAIIVLGTYILINFILGNIIEPKFMGKGLGLSALVIFLSLIFWGWLFGTIGMLLAIPLTMVAKIALSEYESTKVIAILIGSESPSNK